MMNVAPTIMQIGALRDRFMRYFLIALIAILMVYLSSDPEGRLLPLFVRRHAKKRQRRIAFISLTMILAGLQVYFMWKGDCEATSREAALIAQVSTAHEDIRTQARSIETLVFNVKTSEEGKCRFINCIRDLSRITECGSRPLRFEGLCCEDGVAIFGFGPEDDLEDFAFFSNSQVNEVLSGIRLADRFVDNDGNVRVSTKSEFALVAKMMEAKLPPKSTNEIEQAKAVDRIRDGMRTVLRYAYRAECISISWTYRSVDSVRNGVYVSFCYAANPLAREKRMLSAELILSLEDFDSLFGLNVREFNARFIEFLTRAGIDSKVRPRDVSGLNDMIRGKEGERTFPYKKQ